MESDFTPDFAIITPLEVEYRAVTSLLDDQRPVSGDLPTTRGRIGKYTAVVCYPGQPTTSAAADMTRYVVTKWRPRWVVLLGVAGGFLDAGLRAGDVVLASRIYGYEYGKVSDKHFQRRDLLDTFTNGTWVAFAEVASGGPGADREAWAGDFAARRPDGSNLRPRIHIGPVASGDKVVDDPTYKFFEEARRSMPDLYAIEMEAAGAGTSLRRLAAEEKYAGLVMVRGISDTPRPPGDSTELPRGTAERDAWKEYASSAAAAFLSYLLNLEGTPLPRNAAASLRQTVRALASDVQRVGELEDLLVDASANARQSAPRISGNLPGVASDLGSQAQTVIDTTETLRAACAALAVYGRQEDHRAMLKRTLEMVSAGGNENVQSAANLPLLPALLTMYAAGVAATARHQFANLAALTVAPSYHEPYSGMQPVLTKVNVENFGFCRDLLPLTRPVPISGWSDYLYLHLQSEVGPYVVDLDAYEAAFSVFEFLLGVCYFDRIGVQRWYQTINRQGHGEGAIFGRLTHSHAAYQAVRALLLDSTSDGRLAQAIDVLFEGDRERFAEAVRIFEKQSDFAKMGGIHGLVSALHGTG